MALTNHFNIKAELNYFENDLLCAKAVVNLLKGRIGIKSSFSPEDNYYTLQFFYEEVENLLCCAEYDINNLREKIENNINYQADENLIIKFKRIEGTLIPGVIQGVSILKKYIDESPIQKPANVRWENNIIFRVSEPLMAQLEEKVEYLWNDILIAKQVIKCLITQMNPLLPRYRTMRYFLSACNDSLISLDMCLNKLKAMIYTKKEELGQENYNILWDVIKSQELELLDVGREYNLIEREFQHKNMGLI